MPRFCGPSFAILDPSEGLIDIKTGFLKRKRARNIFFGEFFLKKLRGSECLKMNHFIQFDLVLFSLKFEKDFLQAKHSNFLSKSEENEKFKQIFLASSFFFKFKFQRPKRSFFTQSVRKLSFISFNLFIR